MTLLEYMNANIGEEIAVHDCDYEMESYFYGVEPTDDWDKAMQKIAGLLEVKEIENEEPSPLYVAGVTVNMSELIENNLDKMTDLFIIPTVDAIMSDMPNILSGYVSEKWLIEFAEALAN